MPAVEIDEVELLRLRKQDQTVHALMANPKAKKKIFEAYKEHDPNARIPELEIEEAAKAPVAALEKQVSELTKIITDDRAERAQRETIDSIKGKIEASKVKFKKAGWFDDDIAAVEKLMEEKGTTDFELAAAYYEKQRPSQEVATPRGVGNWNFVDSVNEGEQDLTKLIQSKGQNESLADKMAREALAEIRGASRR